MHACHVKQSRLAVGVTHLFGVGPSVCLSRLFALAITILLSLQLYSSSEPATNYRLVHSASTELN